MRYWWASQGKNFQHVARQGNLWTCPPAGGRSRPDRELIKELAPGDLVFHYGRTRLRAVSEVTAPWIPWERPKHYDRKPGEGDDGWLVETEPIVVDLEVPLGVLVELVSHGSPGPLDVNGRPMQKFLSELEPGDAAAMIQLVGTDVAQAETQVEADDDRVWTGENTSAVREALARREQSALRRHLLGGQGQGTCDLCGRSLPAELLVAAHILPRHLLSEEERRELNRVAMLACLLGCDALFEHGYLAVDDSGLVQDLSDPGLPDLSASARRIAGRHCAAHTRATADGFAAHFALAQRLRRRS